MKDAKKDNWVEVCLEAIKNTKVAVFGDFGIDAYWQIDADESELSTETGLPVRRVRKQRYSLGGAANVAANLAALGVRKSYAVGLIGDDLYGGLMLRMLKDIDVDTTGMLTCQQDWQSFVFGKPYIDDAEQNRIDFGGFNKITDASVQTMGNQLDSIADTVDIVILNQQVPEGVSTPKMIEKINTVIASHPECKFIVDSRNFPEMYTGAILKVNAHEAARVIGEDKSLDERITAQQAKDYASNLYNKTNKPVFVTRGENGIVIADQAGIQEIPGIQIIQQTDTVGAGDTTVAALAAALGGGVDNLSAAKLANIAASIVVRKIQTTGTASPDEIRQIGPDPDYIYLPELADDIRKANYIDGSEIEVIRQLPKQLNIQHAIFDHDGTISTFRQGWEQVMEPMMIRAILGNQYDNADEVLYHKVVDISKHFIDKTTGIQTLVQMQGLVELVEQFGCVPKDKILNMYGYKAIYNDALLNMIHRRIEKLNCGELNPEDFQMKNARKLLEELYAKGVKLYLASGTDEADVIAEAKALGYADLFEGRIFGAVGDITVETKRVVLERIINENDLSGSEFATFGDGPVEMRECHKRGGIAIGIAGDEVRRFGLNPAKRTRLIRAGADLIVPDFSQLNKLLGTLRLL